MHRIEGLTDDQLRVFEDRAEAAMRIALQQVMDTIAGRIGRIQTASGMPPWDVLVAHLPGKHNQKDHGRGGGGSGSSGGRPKKAAKPAGGSGGGPAGGPAQGEAALEAAPYRLYVRGPESSEGVSREQMDGALTQYSGSRYGQINGDLRAGGPVPPRSRTAVKRIDAAMESSQLTSDVEVQRVVQAGPVAFGGTWQRNMTGVEYRDGGYTSTSANEHIRDVGYKYSTGIAVMTIRVPQGTHAVSLARANDDAEMEILLDRGLTYRVTGDSMVDGVRHLDVEVVG